MRIEFKILVAIVENLKLSSWPDELKLDHVYDFCFTFSIKNHTEEDLNNRVKTYLPGFEKYIEIRELNKEKHMAARFEKSGISWPKYFVINYKKHDLTYDDYAKLETLLKMKNIEM